MLTPAEEIIRDEILAAPDVVETIVTEPTLGGFTRIIAYEYHSATVHPTLKYCLDTIYIFPADSTSWGASSGCEEFIRTA